MSKWNKRFVKLLSAVAAGVLVSVSAMVYPIGASAATSIGDEVRIRNAPDTEDDNVIGSLNQGDEVTILGVEQSGDGSTWYYVQLENGNTGYVRADFIEASEEELRQFNEEAQEAEPAEEEQEAEPQEKADEPAEAKEEENTEEENTAEKEQPAAEENKEEAGNAETAKPADYDATKDPNAHFSVKYETESDGSGNWYVYNDDNGSKIRISDMNGGESDAKAAGGPGAWKPAAIIFGILTVCLAAFALYLIKSIRDGRKSSRRRNLEVAGYSPYEEEDDEDGDDDDYYFDDDDEAPEEEVRDTTVELKEPEDAEPTAVDLSQEKEEEVVPPEASETEKEDLPDEEEPAVKSEDPDSAKKNAKPEPAKDKAPLPAVGEVLPSSEEAPAAPEKVSPSEQQGAPAEKTIPVSGPDREETGSEDDESDADYREEDGEFDDEEPSDVQPVQAEPDDEDYVDDDDEYDDEEYYEEDDEFEDEEDSEEPVRRRGGSGRDKGSFFGFLRKIFGSESREDADDDADSDEEEEEEERGYTREFDEYKEYPEDIEYLPREEDDYEEDDDFDNREPSYDQKPDSGQGRLSMQRVMKNVRYREEENDFSGREYDDDDPEDFTDPLLDDDDDMSYSFIESSRKK